MPALKPIKTDVTPLLHFLVTGELPQAYAASESGREEALAAWLIHHNLGSLGYFQARNRWPELARFLLEEQHQAVAQNALRKSQLMDLQSCFTALSERPVLLKGAALNATTYPQEGIRTMGDIDLWIPQKKLPDALHYLRTHGAYELYQEPASQEWLVGRASDEYQLLSRKPGHSLLELHGRLFAGWWVATAGAVDEQEIWERARPLASLPPFYVLEPADQLLHVALHLAVNHQFGLAGLRSLVDLAFTIMDGEINWDDLLDRASRWRLRAVLWRVLTLLDELFQLNIPPRLLTRLAPPRWQRYLLRQLVPNRALLSGSDWRSSPRRYLILLLLIDRGRDRRKIIGQALWPGENTLEPSDSGKSFLRLRRVWHMVRRREII